MLLPKFSSKKLPACLVSPILFGPRFLFINLLNQHLSSSEELNWCLYLFPLHKCGAQEIKHLKHALTTYSKCPFGVLYASAPEINANSSLALIVILANNMHYPLTHDHVTLYLDFWQILGQEGEEEGEEWHFTLAGDEMEASFKYHDERSERVHESFIALKGPINTAPKWKRWGKSANGNYSSSSCKHSD